MSYFRLSARMVDWVFGYLEQFFQAVVGFPSCSESDHPKEQTASEKFVALNSVSGICCPRVDPLFSVQLAGTVSLFFETVSVSEVSHVQLGLWQGGRFSSSRFRATLSTSRRRTLPNSSLLGLLGLHLPRGVHFGLNVTWRLAREQALSNLCCCTCQMSLFESPLCLEMFWSSLNAF